MAMPEAANINDHAQNDHEPQAVKLPAEEAEEKASPEASSPEDATVEVPQSPPDKTEKEDTDYELLDGTQILSRNEVIQDELPTDEDSPTETKPARPTKRQTRVQKR